MVWNLMEVEKKPLLILTMTECVSAVMGSIPIHWGSWTGIGRQLGKSHCVRHFNIPHSFLSLDPGQIIWLWNIPSSLHLLFSPSRHHASRTDWDCSNDRQAAFNLPPQRSMFLNSRSQTNCTMLQYCPPRVLCSGSLKLFFDISLRFVVSLFIYLFVYYLFIPHHHPFPHTHTHWLFWFGLQWHGAIPPLPQCLCVCVYVLASACLHQPSNFRQEWQSVDRGCHLSPCTPERDGKNIELDW